MYDDRIANVDAIARRAAAAVTLVRDYHRKVIARAANLPLTNGFRKTDPT